MTESATKPIPIERALNTDILTIVYIGGSPTLTF